MKSTSILRAAKEDEAEKRQRASQLHEEVQSVVPVYNKDLRRATAVVKLKNVHSSPSSEKRMKRAGFDEILKAARATKMQKKVELNNDKFELTALEPTTSSLKRGKSADAYPHRVRAIKPGMDLEFSDVL